MRDCRLFKTLLRSRETFWNPLVARARTWWVSGLEAGRLGGPQGGAWAPAGPSAPAPCLSDHATPTHAGVTTFEREGRVAGGCARRAASRCRSRGLCLPPVTGSAWPQRPPLPVGCGPAVLSDGVPTSSCPALWFRGWGGRVAPGCWWPAACPRPLRGWGWGCRTVGPRCLQGAALGRQGGTFLSLQTRRAAFSAGRGRKLPGRHAPLQ